MKHPQQQLNKLRVNPRKSSNLPQLKSFIAISWKKTQSEPYILSNSSKAASLQTYVIHSNKSNNLERTVTSLVSCLHQQVLLVLSTATGQTTWKEFSKVKLYTALSLTYLQQHAKQLKKNSQNFSNLNTAASLTQLIYTTSRRTQKEFSQLLQTYSQQQV